MSFDADVNLRIVFQHRGSNLQDLAASTPRDHLAKKEVNLLGDGDFLLGLDHKNLIWAAVVIAMAILLVEVGIGHLYR